MALCYVRGGPSLGDRPPPPPWGDQPDIRGGISRGAGGTWRIRGADRCRAGLWLKRRLQHTKALRPATALQKALGGLQRQHGRDAMEQKQHLCRAELSRGTPFQMTPTHELLGSTYLLQEGIRKLGQTNTEQANHKCHSFRRGAGGRNNHNPRLKMEPSTNPTIYTCPLYSFMSLHNFHPSTPLHNQLQLNTSHQPQHFSNPPEPSALNTPPRQLCLVHLPTSSCKGIMHIVGLVVPPPPL